MARRLSTGTGLGTIIDLSDCQASEGATGANNVNAFMRAHDRIPAEGGIIYVPPGIWRCSFPTGTQFTKPTLIMGAGLRATIIRDHPDAGTGIFKFSGIGHKIMYATVQTTAQTALPSIVFDSAAEQNGIRLKDSEFDQSTIASTTASAIIEWGGTTADSRLLATDCTFKYKQNAIRFPAGTSQGDAFLTGCYLFGLNNANAPLDSAAIQWDGISGDSVRCRLMSSHIDVNYPDRGTVTQTHGIRIKVGASQGACPLWLMGSVIRITDADTGSYTTRGISVEGGDTSTLVNCVGSDVEVSSSGTGACNAAATTAASFPVLRLFQGRYRSTAASGTPNDLLQSSNGTLQAFGPDYVTRSGLITGTAGSPASGVYVGAGTPEAAVTAPVGSVYRRTDGGAGTTLYVKESGSGNVGWIAK